MVSIVYANRKYSLRDRQRPAQGSREVPKKTRGIDLVFLKEEVNMEGGKADDRDIAQLTGTQRD